MRLLLKGVKFLGGIRGNFLFLKKLIKFWQNWAFYEG